MVCGHLCKLCAMVVCPNVSERKDACVLPWLEFAEEQR